MHRLRTWTDSPHSTWHASAMIRRQYRRWVSLVRQGAGSRLLLTQCFACSVKHMEAKGIAVDSPSEDVRRKAALLPEVPDSGKASHPPAARVKSRPEVELPDIGGKRPLRRESTMAFESLTHACSWCQRCVFKCIVAEQSLADVWSPVSSRGISLKRCGGCKVDHQYYCSRECQQACCSQSVHTTSHLGLACPGALGARTQASVWQAMSIMPGSKHGRNDADSALRGRRFLTLTG
jgi:hypothetical protein